MVDVKGVPNPCFILEIEKTKRIFYNFKYQSFSLSVSFARVHPDGH